MLGGTPGLLNEESLVADVGCRRLSVHVCRRCIREQHSEYLDIVIPESLRQRTAAPLFEDLWLFEQAWDFDVAAMPPVMQKTIHVWHGTGDKQVAFPDLASDMC